MLDTEVLPRPWLKRVSVCAGSCCNAGPLHLTETPGMRASGTFEVRVKPQQADNADAQAAGLARMALDKRFHGAIEGESHGEMLALGDGRTNGAYVAVEKVSGRLDGREGSFGLVHRALMRNGQSEQWSILVVPGSGTGELAGIDGSLTITITNGVHSYELQYTLPDAQPQAAR